MAYAQDQISPKFQVHLSELGKVITNYKELNEEEEKTVTDISYENDK